MRELLVRLETNDPQEIHADLARLFLRGGRPRGYLFAPVVLPDGSLGARVRIADENETRGREVVVPAIGEESDFVLRAFAAGKNPDGKKRDDKKRAFPAAPKFDADRMKWLTRQADAHGFSVLRATFTMENSAVRRPAGIFGFNVVVFVGRLKVDDPAKFKAAMQNGIGTRRGYGCGMLILRPDSPTPTQPTHKRSAS